MTRFLSMRDPIGEGFFPPLLGGTFYSKRTSVLPYPSSPALFRKGTTSWNHGRPRTHFAHYDSHAARSAQNMDCVNQNKNPPSENIYFLSLYVFACVWIFQWSRKKARQGRRESSGRRRESKINVF